MPDLKQIRILNREPVLEDVPLTLMGRFMYAQEATERGLVSACVEREDFMAKVLETAAMIDRYEPLAIRLTKEAIHGSLEGMGLDAIFKMENRNQRVITAHSMNQRRRKAIGPPKGQADKPAEVRA